MSNKKRRFAPDVRMEQIVETACKLSIRLGYTKVTRDEIGAACGVSGQAVMYHFKTMSQLRRAVMRCAVRNEVLAVIAQGLTVKDPQARRADPALQRRALLAAASNA